MQSGLLTERIEVYILNVTTNAYGELVIEWVRAYETKAKVDYIKGNRDVENSEIVVNYTKTFTIRLYHLIKENDRIKWLGKYYRITNIEANNHYQNKVINTELVNE